MVNANSKERPVWQLPVAGAERRGNAYIHPSAKYHCFVDNSSLCGMYNQRTLDYDDGITVESGVLLLSPHFGCQKCYQRWRREYGV